MKRLGKLLCLSLLACALLAALACPAYARSAGRDSAYAPYLVPPQVPKATGHVRELLKGSSVKAQDGWIVAYLSGSPYEIGFQNGYYTAQSADYWILCNQGDVGSDARLTAATVARDYVWRLVSKEYQQEMQGIADGMKAAGYPQDTLWDVVAANNWADQAVYESLLPQTVKRATTAFHRNLVAEAEAGRCSSFVATGAWTKDSKPVLGHETWYSKQISFMYNVMLYINEDNHHGYDLAIDTCGGQIWSGQDWYINSAGFLLSETSLSNDASDPTGVPSFVRARQAAQYSRTVDDAVKIFLNKNNGGYPNEWLMADRTGKIATLQLGCKAYDLSTTTSGFYGSCNYAWGPNFLAEAGKSLAPASPRWIRWPQLAAQYKGQIDAEVGKTMLSDTYDVTLGKIWPDKNTICGEPENSTTALYGGTSTGGAIDGKVATVDMALHGLRQWARWGRPNGDPFSAALFLQHNPNWATSRGPFAVFGLQTFADQTQANPWTLMKEHPASHPWGGCRTSHKHHRK
jgi:hypothetical protein